MSIRDVQNFQFGSELLEIDHKQSQKTLKVPNLHEFGSSEKLFLLEA